ncbi:hypothetical protein GZ78_01750 [Endozoicomonas numazuensis]|uniref:LysR substrate-binding domain-containing protein n=2 Tax=Endozoicomonas numazuensis TaxID=1137799 RepID=A0A081NK53_9GAMM|nr:hypothetical protein GZ78_01750 [Endozoicomonas numazuensis]
MPWTLVSEVKTEAIDVSGNFICSNIEAVKQAVAAGLGIGQIPVNNMVCELKKHELIRVLPDWHGAPMPIYLVYRPGVNKLKRVEAILEYLLSIQEQFEFTPDLHLCQPAAFDRSEMTSNQERKKRSHWPTLCYPS